MRALARCLVLTVLLGSGSCGGDGGPGGGNNTTTLEQLNERFPFNARQPLDAIYACLRTGSVLEYLFDLRADSSMTLFSTLDTGDVIFRNGSHSLAEGVISLSIPPNDFLTLEESSTNTVIALGTIVLFDTPNMRCAIVGHRYDDPQAQKPNANYGCPRYSEGAGSDVENAIEFQVWNDSPPSHIPGSIFRQRDRYPTGSPRAITERGHGIYRRQAAAYYGYFGTQFDDYNIVTGQFSNNDQTITVDQEPIGQQQCTRR